MASRWRQKAALAGNISSDLSLSDRRIVPYRGDPPLRRQAWGESVSILLIFLSGAPLRAARRTLTDFLNPELLKLEPPPVCHLS